MFRKRRKENTTCRQNIYDNKSKRYIWIKESFMEDINVFIVLQAIKGRKNKKYADVAGYLL